MACFEQLLISNTLQVTISEIKATRPGLVGDVIIEVLIVFLRNVGIQFSEGVYLKFHLPWPRPNQVVLQWRVPSCLKQWHLRLE